MLHGGYIVALISKAEMMQLELKMRPIIILLLYIVNEGPCTLLRGLFYFIALLFKDKSKALAWKLVYLI